jgi:FAD:protein FMN transferase
MKTSLVPLTVFLPVLLAVAGCGHRTTVAAAARPAAPELPPMHLESLQGEFERLATAGPPGPDSKHLAELVQLGGTAFASNTEKALAARCRRDLLDDPDASYALEQLLQDKDLDVRSQAAYELGRHGGHASWLPLLQRLRFELHRQTRIWLDAALAQLGNGSGLTDLAQRMDEWDVADRAGNQAIEILRRANRDPGPAPTYVDLKTQLAALSEQWDSTGVLPPDTEEQPADALCARRIAERIAHLQDVDLRTVDESRFIFSHCGHLPLPLLRRAAHASEPYLRVHTLEILRYLGAIGNAAAGDVLPLLADPLSHVEAAQALAEMQAQQAAPFLCQWLVSPEVERRAVACNALGILADRRAAPRLEELLADVAQPQDVRVQAAFALALFARERPAYTFLQERAGLGDYHLPTVRELLDRVDGWQDPRLREVAGTGFGGDWRIRYVGGRGQSEVRTAVEAVLEEFAHAFDPRRKDSGICAYNQHATTAPFPASETFRTVLATALQVAERTAGAFDPTRRAHAGKDAEDAVATDAPGPVDWHCVRIDGDNVVKARADVQLDLGGIAVGACVDRMALALRRLGVRGALVTLADRTVAFGVRAPGEPWTQAARWALAEGSSARVAAAAGGSDVVLRECALAMLPAGNAPGGRASRDEEHPGEQGDERVLAVMVRAADAALADGLAHACRVLAPAAAGKIVREWPPPGPGALLLVQHGASAQVVDLGWTRAR